MFCFISSTNIVAQSDEVGPFKVMNIRILDPKSVRKSSVGYQDENNNNSDRMIVTLYNQGDFHDYSAVQVVTNKKGDTLAVGISQYYGHMQKTEKDYLLWIRQSEVTNIDTLVVHFGSLSDTYMLLEYIVPKNKERILKKSFTQR